MRYERIYVYNHIWYIKKIYCKEIKQLSVRSAISFDDVFDAGLCFSIENTNIRNICTK